ncbi:MAG: sulfotransferase [Methylovulum sp.]|uniref:sulfotransferase domain-containing protein n=1 Tax=Methylovulum sp. TaxID=1916980 RepID=UPI0026302D25|nr:sulfotransferase domain-containing protein [Methylovulum sp.]MDD2725334.1 sulfotransferase [Methylovulum sp.]MDD5124841.1 sulfotransferase [Methylovulum sp.]
MTKLFDKLYLNVGAMKAGTTWLYRQLEQHPEIVFSHEKELHYLAYRDGNKHVLNQKYKANRRDNALARFNGDKSSPEYAQLLQWYESHMETTMDDAWYRGRFPGQLAARQYCADFSNLTCLVGVPTWEAILAMVGQVKVSYVLRNPYDRMWSHYKFHYQMQQFNVHPDKLTEDDFRAFDKANQTMLHSSYSQHIVRMRQCVDSDSLKLVAYDDIQLQPAVLLRGIEDFLGINHHQYLPGKVKRKINASESLSAPDCFYKTFAEAVDKELAALAGLGFDIPKSWFAGGSV